MTAGDRGSADHHDIVVQGEYAREVDGASLRDKLMNGEPVKESRRVVVALMRSEEINAVIEWLEEEYAGTPGFSIEDHGTFYRIDADEGFEIDCDEIEPIIGHPYNVYDLLVNVSTTIGRAMTVGNKFVMTTSLVGLEEAVPRAEARPVAGRS